MNHRLTGLQAHSAVPLAIMVVALSISVPLQTGCGDFSLTTRGNTSAKSMQSNLPARFVIDAGIVFSQEASYFCIPLSRVGVVESSEVLSVTSTCECCIPSVVQYVEVDGATGRALRIDFIGGSDASVCS